MARVRAVLFDIDGTLLDSNDAHAHSWLDALRGHGVDVPYDRVRSKIGMGGEKLLMDVAGIDHESTRGKLITERRIAVFKALYLPDVGPLPGGRALVERLKNRGFKRAVVTSASEAELADLLREAAVANLFDVTISRADAERSNLDPDLVEIALQRLDVGPREAVMIGDTPYDIASAARAGVSTIALRSGGWKDVDLEGAVAIYDHPQDLLTQIDRSPIVVGVSDVMETASPKRKRARRPAEGNRL
jgi:HAD superfamily hydrolase (TIGR01509 family)